jgi:hypothetical protein
VGSPRKERAHSKEKWCKARGTSGLIAGVCKGAAPASAKSARERPTAGAFDKGAITKNSGTEGCKKKKIWCFLKVVFKNCVFLKRRGGLPQPPLLNPEGPKKILKQVFY